MEQKVGSRGIVMVRKKNQVEELTHPLQKRRIQAGLRQRDLAEAINKPTSYIGRIENETLNINNLSMANGYKLSRVLGCRMEDLLIKEDL